MNGMLNYHQMGNRIVECRQERGITQLELARQAGVSTSFIGQMERAEKIPSLDTVARLCDALNVSMDYLVFGRKGQYCDQKRCELYEDMRKVLRDYAGWGSG